ncbi:tetratricopeptide repeat protein [Polaromonas sp. YR568]|uniref:tetratricopeptide repeat protein n=1 Tax=Polaromonas sp. YR568 TaxID=1855301 RepID=UPI00398BF834
MNPVLGQKESDKATHPAVESFLLAGQRLIWLLKWCVIALVLVLGFALAAVHVLARTTYMPSEKVFVAQLYTDDIWWHPTDKAYAKVLLREAMAAGEVKAQYRLARDYEKEKNYTEAFPLHQDLALKGFTASQTRLGLMYMDGRGVSQNTAVAIRWLKSAAAQGDATAHYFIGWIYLGELPDMPQDLAQAMQWFQSSAYLGDGQARDVMARFYATGKGVPEDLDLAMRWAKSSLDAGYGEATKTIELIQTIRAEKGQKK